MGPCICESVLLLFSSLGSSAQAHPCSLFVSRLQDRSADEKLGAQSFFADFKTFTTCSILKLAKPEGQLSPEQLLEWVLAEQKNNVGCAGLWPAATALQVDQQQHPGVQR